MDLRKILTTPIPPLPSRVVVIVLALSTFWFAYAINLRSAGHFDLTLRIASALLEGRLGLSDAPPSWLNESVPRNGSYYSVFPLGNVLCMVPFAILSKVGLLAEFPTRTVVALLAAATSVFAFLLTGTYGLPNWRRVLFAIAIVFGSCLWPNLAYGGAWQVAIALAVIGQLAALVFLRVYPRPLLAGIGFAIAFGNRTELILTAPLFYYLLSKGRISHWRDLPALWKPVLAFSAVPFLLGVLTLAYNAARFSSPLDFGYSRIPGVMDEPWYRHGLFSLWAVPMNVYHMLFEGWKRIGVAPWLVPTGWGGSVFLFSPFLILLFRRGARAFDIKAVAWTAIVLLTLVLWLHGNPGGWQISYRYGAILLPWVLLILAESSRRKNAGWEPALIAVSVIINVYAGWLFCCTAFMKP